jgi:asparagine synthase (glutamine-hydrolysing)
MCGIFGVIWHGSADVPDEHRLQRTARLLRHRGPDDTGIYADRGIGLVQTRLSLLDLSPRSNQPFWDKQRRYCLVYNGEIYNFKELRVEMEQQGIQFTTTSDTEVLLEGLINCGVEATLPKLEGMYAFALYDSLEKSLTLARDPFGIKPLFIYNGDYAFIFTS